PISGWRESYAALLEELLTTVSPETLGFCSLIWMDYQQLTTVFTPGQIDPDFVEAARLAQEEMKGIRQGPFPHAIRAELYRFLIAEARRHAPRLPLFISTESNRMWDELAPELGQQGHRFLCGCNPIQGPGPKFLRSTLK